MPLSTGSKLGPYEVLSLLGVGGMGEVYRARDTRLGRVVAIKVLPSERMADEHRRRRFVQEARSASALNHPNIVTIHEIESADGIDFIVMEYVEGETLDAVIPSQGLRLGEVLRVAIPIADAVARAHVAGIVHRDLKPTNIMVGSAGVVKVLDFGLAKLVTFEPGGPDHETVSEDGDAGPLSRSGMVVGTAGYMSPEQATGKEVDARSDVFSFGAVLYEMVTGRRAFAGNSTAETLAAVVRDQPKALSEVVDVPKELDRLIQRCLRKEPERRFQHMLDAKLELEQIKEDSASRALVSPIPARGRRLRWLAAALGGALLVAAAIWLGRPPREIAPPPAQLVALTGMRGWEDVPAFSPDGNEIVFTWGGESLVNSEGTNLYIKMIGSSETHRLTTGPAGGGDGMASWSPDGRQIAFVRVPNSQVREIRLVSPLGGSDRKLSDFPVGEGQLSWSPDGRWLAASRNLAPADTDPGAGSIYFIPVEGGEPHRVTSPKKLDCDTDPAFSWDGRRLAYVSCGSSENWCHIEVLNLGADGFPSGPATRLPPRVGGGGLAWARDGKSVIYGADDRIWRVGASGERPPERIELAGFAANRPVTTASRDRLAFVRYLTNVDIYRFEVGRPPEAALASSFFEGAPSFSPDGRRIAFVSQRSGERHAIWLAAADGTNPTQLTHGPGVSQGSPRFSPDGRRVAFDSWGEDGHWDIYLTDADAGVPHRLTQDPGDENLPSWSRDGRFIYFSKTILPASVWNGRAGDHDVWRIPAAGGPEERLTHGGGELAYESADGQTLYFKRGAGHSPLLALPLTGGPERQVLDCVPSNGFTIGPGGVYYFGCQDFPSRTLHVLDPVTRRDRVLGKLEMAGGTNGGLAVSPDGKTILYSRVVGEGSDLMMIENFR